MRPWKKGSFDFSTPPTGPMTSLLLKRTKVWRVTNYCALNTVTVKNRYPLPLSKDLFDTLAGAKIFSKIDFVVGYNKVRIAAEDKPKTIFSHIMGFLNVRS